MKRFILLLSVLLPLFAQAQIPAAKDTALYSPSTAYTLQARYSNVTINGVSYRIPQFYNPIAGKYDSFVTTKYLSGLYAKLFGGNIFTGDQIINDSGYGLLFKANPSFSSGRIYSYDGTHDNTDYALDFNASATGLNGLYNVRIGIGGNTAMQFSSTGIDIVDPLRLYPTLGSSGDNQLVIDPVTGLVKYRVGSGGGTTTNPLTLGYGLLGTSFNGSSAVTAKVDSGEFVNKTYFNGKIGTGVATALAGKAPESGSANYIQNKYGSNTAQSNSKLHLTDSIITDGIVKAAYFTNGNDISKPNPHNFSYGFIQGGGSYTNVHTGMQLMGISLQNSVTDSPYSLGLVGIHNATSIGSANTQNWTARVGQGNYTGRSDVAGGGIINSSFGVYLTFHNTKTSEVLTNRRAVWVDVADGTGTTNYNAILVASPEAMAIGSLGNTGLLIGNSTIPAGNYGIYNAGTYGNFLGTGASTMGGGFINTAKATYGALEFMPKQRLDSLYAPISGGGYVLKSDSASTANNYVTYGKYLYGSSVLKNKDLSSSTNIIQAYQTIQNAGTSVTQRKILNVGYALKVVDDGSSKSVISLDSAAAPHTSFTSSNATIAITNPTVGTINLDVIKNANLTGPITSVGNATSIASQTGTGTKFVMDTSPTLVTPTINTMTLTTQIGSTPSGGSVIFGKGATNNAVGFAGSNGFIASFSSASLTAARTATMPDNAGTLYSSTLAVGTIPYASSTTATAGLAIGSTDQILKVASGLPAWGALNLASASAVTGLLPDANIASASTWNASAITTATITSSSTITPSSNIYAITALAADATFAAPSLTATFGKSLLIRIKDNGTPRSLGWNGIYRYGTDFALPSTTVAGQTMYIQFVYNSTDTAWDAVGLTRGF